MDYSQDGVAAGVAGGGDGEEHGVAGAFDCVWRGKHGVGADAASPGMPDCAVCFVERGGGCGGVRGDVPTQVDAGKAAGEPWVGGAVAGGGGVLFVVVDELDAGGGDQSA